ncbi:uncharacterized protein KNAG_0B07000 [Huiozyma naganishii CBS 8797]|uniref:Uncharacterized protein n=1 Tax=Huiozyma naganishii (strain ATCC MYA-139 / BCRC 22969 / CBS 8797 / KCTC 17520 / NBRC 10181 / NCYC 3082 / Yp74L-3) TaxID=1071383 RepID=J7S471_HUIN7|nr:hypothetical protein KNAG_0B07000 [Kazachstania naganishii CBS 8797]CCK69124.1 hypothetical protein KNAG_0B07000 [Kazachstania naganishii CBS 8797]
MRELDSFETVPNCYSVLQGNTTVHGLPVMRKFRVSMTVLFQHGLFWLFCEPPTMRSKVSCFDISRMPDLYFVTHDCYLYTGLQTCILLDIGIFAIFIHSNEFYLDGDDIIHLLLSNIVQILPYIVRYLLVKQIRRRLLVAKRNTFQCVDDNCGTTVTLPYSR